MSTDPSTNIIFESFKVINLSKEHALTYITLLKQGKSGAREIALLTKIPRSTTYDLLNDLIKIGLVSLIEEKIKRVFSPSDPRSLLDLVNKKRLSLQNKEKDLQANLSSLRSLYLSQKEEVPKVRLYKGEGGLKTVLYDSLNTKELLVLCLGSEEGQSSLDKDPWYLTDFINEAGHRKMKCREILEDTPASREYKKKYESKNDLIILIPKNTSQKIKHVDKQIYGNKVAYISHDNLVGVIIEDASIAEHERAEFEVMWKMHRNIN